MTRMMATVISVVPILIAVAGCAARAPDSPVGTGAASPVGNAAADAAPSRYATMVVIPAGGQNPQAGTGKVPVWQWAEVVQGPGFLLEIRIPNQAANADPGAALARITATAYRRAAAFLASNER